jgi:hypothetical protein
MKKKQRKKRLGIEPSYSEWTVIREDGYSGKNQMLLCQCVCGTERRVRLDNLRRGTSQDCGCGRRENLVGQKFGKLEVKEFLRMQARNQILRCSCECGSEKEVDSDSLKSGNTQSCGCLVSVNNSEIAAWLISSGYQFEAEYKDKRCRRKNPLPFDFAVWLDGQLHLIEFQGWHHYHTGGRYPPERLARVKESDELKRRFCEENSIPLLAIPYWQRKDKLHMIEGFLKF